MNDQEQLAGTSASLKTCHDLEYLLLGDLRQLLDEPQTAQTLQSLLVILDRLLGSLPCRFALACENGYMTEVLEERPTLHRQIQALRSANVACISSLEEMRSRIVHELPLAAITDEVNLNLYRWMRSLVAIRSHENRLYQEAFTLDYGGEA